jgi:REP element-mobilizing transposase RayT
MTMPRQVLPNSTSMVTRRCAQRQLLLRPSALVNQIVLYCVAVAADKYGVLLHALCVMSNHYHLTLTDPHGLLPEFERWVNEFVAKAVNASLRRWESLWASGSYHAGHLEAPTDVLGAMTYTIANPVKAGLVTRSDLWPGLCTLPSDIGRPMRVKRPNVLFRKDGPLPEEVEVTFVPPPAYSDLSLAEFVALLRESVEAEEERLRAKAREEGRSFLGRRAVLDQNPFDFPRTREERRRLRPRIRCRDKWRRIELIKRLKAFLQDYREAYDRFRAGFREVIFPPGTYWMRRYAGARCAPG